MFMPLKHMAQQETAAKAEALSAKYNAIALIQMEKAKSPSLIGEILITRPGMALGLTKSGQPILEDVSASDLDCEYEDDADEDDNDDRLHSPMLYVCGETQIHGKSYYKLINLNAPTCTQERLKDLFNTLQAPFKKHPVFFGGHIDNDEPLKLLIPTNSIWAAYHKNTATKTSHTRTPLSVIEGETAVKMVLGFAQNIPVLAFKGYLLMPKDDVKQHLAMENLYAVHGLRAETALSPYAESKYLQTFAHMGLDAEDITRLSNKTKAMHEKNRLKH